MARARVAVSAVRLPDHLHWRNVAAFISDETPLPPWADSTSLNAVFAFRKIQATRDLRAARSVFLSYLKEKPDGISAGEFLAAHGLTREALGTSMARSLGL